MIDISLPRIGATYKDSHDVHYIVHYVSKNPLTGETVIVYEDIENFHNIYHMPINEFMKPDRFIMVKPPKFVPMD